MTMSNTVRRPVTERDFRQPEFRDARPSDYEFDEAGELVRKDRWERALRAIAGALELRVDECGVESVVQAVEALATDEKLWFSQAETNDGWDSPPSPSTTVLWPPTDKPVVVRLHDQSILFGATFSYEAGAGSRWQWNGRDFTDKVVAWRSQHNE